MTFATKSANSRSPNKACRHTSGQKYQFSWRFALIVSKNVRFRFDIFVAPRDQMALFNALDTPVLIGSAASVATC
jgi:hypothetical protein